MDAAIMSEDIFSLIKERESQHLDFKASFGREAIEALGASFFFARRLP